MTVFKSAVFFGFAVCAAVSSLQAQSLGSCPIFRANNPWNMRIDNLPVHPRSQHYIDSVAGIGGKGLGGTIHVHPDFGSDPHYGIPWEAVSGSQPFVPIDLTNGYIDESDPGPMPIPPDARVEGGGVGDAHVLVVDTSNHHLYELYQGKKQANGWAATSSAVFALDSNNYRPDGWTSCDAAGLPIFPGLVRMYECKQGEIKHALRFTVPYTSRGYIFPARHHAGATYDTTNIMPMGLRLRLKSSFDDSKDTGMAKVITTALKRYGIILADNGSSWFISGETNTQWDDDDIGQLKKITGNDFEVVYSGPIRVKPNQYPDPTFGVDTVGVFYIAQNPFQFGDVQQGTKSTKTFSMKNTGNGTLTINVNNQSGTNPDFALVSVTPLQLPPFRVAPGDSILATVSFTPSQVGQESTEFTLSVTDKPGHVFDTNVVLTGVGTSSSSGVASGDKLAVEVSIYPNPVANVLTITSTENSDESIELFDGLGRSVLTGNLTEGIAKLDVRTLASGNYVLRVRTANGVMSRVVVIER